MRLHPWRLLPLIAVAATAACDRVADVAAPVERPRTHVAVAMECEATVQAVRCGRPGPTITARDAGDAARGALMGMGDAARASWRRPGDAGQSSVLIGPTGDRIEMALELFRYEASPTPRVVFRFDVTNRLAVPMGTADGITPDPDSVRLVFDGTPTFQVTGTQTPPDTVEVENAVIRTLNGPAPTIAIGEGTLFDQPLHDVSSILRPGETAGSAFSIRWRPGVSRVRFRVLVAATVPSPATSLFPPARRWSEVGVGGTFACGLRMEGALYCWGDNTIGILGTDVTLAANGVGPWGDAMVALGEDFACILPSDGWVRCSGLSSAGQVGIGMTGGYTEGLNFINRPDTARARLVMAGESHACYVTAATPRRTVCWGDNAFGQVGVPSGTIEASPVEVSLSTWRPDTLVGGADFSCGLEYASGEVRCWGNNAQGQLGNGGAGAATHVPQLVGGMTADELVAGDHFACARLRSSGLVMCWGRGDKGQLGNGTTANSAIPVAVTGVTGALRLGAGARHACAITTTGTRCWGDNADGQLGTASPEVSNVSVPVPFAGGQSRVVGGDTFTCVLDDGGAVNCVGTSRRGEFGAGTQRVTGTPLLLYSDPAATHVTAHGDAVCVRVPGTSRCFGASVVGRFNLVAIRGRPEGLLTTLTFVKLATGVQHACGITADSAAYCWGENYTGAVGDGTTTDRRVPTLVSGGHRWVDIAAGDRFTCGVLRGPSGPEVRCWGRNTEGQLGIGAVSAQVSLPTTAISLGAGERIVAGTAHACNYSPLGDASNLLVCWGRNADGQLGLGDNTLRAAPAAVTSILAPVSTMAAGDAHTCLVTTEPSADPVVRCAGRNTEGQLGINSTVSSATFSNVVLPSAFATVPPSAVAAGRAHSCAAYTFTVLCWGEGRRGQLSQGGTAQSTVPVTAFFGFSWSDFSQVRLMSNPRSDVTCAWERNRIAPECWGGDNRYYQIPSASVGWRWALGEVMAP